MMLNEDPVDLIISDHKMDEMDGVRIFKKEVMKLIRNV
jgi:hypothetical protein